MHPIYQYIYKYISYPLKSTKLGTQDIVYNNLNITMASESSRRKSVHTKKKKGEYKVKKIILVGPYH